MGLLHYLMFGFQTYVWLLTYLMLSWWREDWFNQDRFATMFAMQRWSSGSCKEWSFGILTKTSSSLLPAPSLCSRPPRLELQWQNSRSVTSPCQQSAPDTPAIGHPTLVPLNGPAPHYSLVVVSGGPVVKIPHSQCKGLRLIPRSGN